MLNWLWLSVLVLVLDQGSKYLAAALLPLHEPVHVLPFFNLTLTYNTGAAFSFLSDASGWQRWFFVSLSFVISVILAVWMARLPRRAVWTAAALGLILGGAVGNLVDRLIHGHVIDFLDFYYRAWHWPAFNVADSAITVGVAMLLWESLRDARAGG